MRNDNLDNLVETLDAALQSMKQATEKLGDIEGSARLKKTIARINKAVAESDEEELKRIIDENVQSQFTEKA